MYLHWSGTLQQTWLGGRGRTKSKRHNGSSSSAAFNYSEPDSSWTGIRLYGNNGSTQLNLSIVNLSVPLSPGDRGFLRRTPKLFHSTDARGEDRVQSSMAVVAIAGIFLFITLTATLALSVFCRKRNTVFVLRRKGSCEDDDEEDDEDEDADAEEEEEEEGAVDDERSSDEQSGGWVPSDGEQPQWDDDDDDDDDGCNEPELMTEKDFARNFGGNNRNRKSSKRRRHHALQEITEEPSTEVAAMSVWSDDVISGASSLMRLAGSRTSSLAECGQPETHSNKSRSGHQVDLHLKSSSNRDEFSITIENTLSSRIRTDNHMASGDHSTTASSSSSSSQPPPQSSPHSSSSPPDPNR